LRAVAAQAVGEPPQIGVRAAVLLVLAFRKQSICRQTQLSPLALKARHRREPTVMVIVALIQGFLALRLVTAVQALARVATLHYLLPRQVRAVVHMTVRVVTCQVHLLWVLARSLAATAVV